MSRFPIPVLFCAAVMGILHPEKSWASAPCPEIVIDVDTQKLVIVKSGQELARFPVSTSKFGVGDEFRSYKTPIGVFKVCDKTGGNLPLGAVLKKGRFTGEVLAPDAPGRDPIVTRMIRLRGLELQNRHTLARGIFIHGTPEERRIGKPVSWGCIRMRSKDVAELYKQVQVGTVVTICGTGRTQNSLEQLGSWISKLWS